jgi:hypothetical protein
MNSRESDIQDQAAFTMKRSGLKEILDGLEGDDPVPPDLNVVKLTPFGRALMCNHRCGAVS